MVAFVVAATASAETLRGLTVAPEHRCSPYDRRRDYPYPESVEQDIVRQLGAVYGHLGTSELLTEAQMARYAALRGNHAAHRGDAAHGAHGQGKH